MPAFAGILAVAGVSAFLASLLLLACPASRSLRAWLPADVPVPIPVAGVPAQSGYPAFAIVHILAGVPVIVVTSVLSNLWLPSSYLVWYPYLL